MISSSKNENKSRYAQKINSVITSKLNSEVEKLGLNVDNLSSPQFNAHNKDILKRKIIDKSKFILSKSSLPSPKKCIKLDMNLLRNRNPSCSSNYNSSKTIKPGIRGISINPLSQSKKSKYYLIQLKNPMNYKLTLNKLKLPSIIRTPCIRDHFNNSSGSSRYFISHSVDNSSEMLSVDDLDVAEEIVETEQTSTDIKDPLLPISNTEEIADNDSHNAKLLNSLNEVKSNSHKDNSCEVGTLTEIEMECQPEKYFEREKNEIAARRIATKKVPNRRNRKRKKIDSCFELPPRSKLPTFISKYVIINVFFFLLVISHDDTAF